MISGFFLAAAMVTAAAPQPDPYGTRPAEAPYSLAYDAERGGAAQDDVIATWLSRHPAAPVAQRAMLAHRLCVDYGVLIGGERRVAACRMSVQLSDDPEDGRDLQLAEAFRKEPPITAAGSVDVPLTRAPEGVYTVDVNVNAVDSAWIVDTGAEITTISETTAKRFGIHVVEGHADVGSLTTTVTGRLGIIDRLSIGTGSAQHVPVLILPDAMLQGMNGRPLPGILGLPVLAAFHRARWSDHAARLMLGEAVPGQNREGLSDRIYWHENGIGVPLSAPPVPLPVQIDTGANSSHLTSATIRSILGPKEMTATKRDSVLVGAGAGVAKTSLEVPTLEYRLAGSPLRATDVTIDPEGHGNGAIGSDAVSQLSHLDIDFDTMTIDAAP